PGTPHGCLGHDRHTRPRVVVSSTFPSPLRGGVGEGGSWRVFRYLRVVVDGYGPGSGDGHVDSIGRAVGRNGGRVAPSAHNPEGLHRRAVHDGDISAASVRRVHMVCVWVERDLV